VYRFPGEWNAARRAGHGLGRDYEGRLLMGDPAQPGTPIEPGDQDDGVSAVAALPDGRAVSGRDDGRDSAHPGTPIELGAHKRSASTVAALPHGRVVTGSTDRIIVRTIPSATELDLACSVTATATMREPDNSTTLVVAYRQRDRLDLQLTFFSYRIAGIQPHGFVGVAKACAGSWSTGFRADLPNGCADPRPQGTRDRIRPFEGTAGWVRFARRRRDCCRRCAVTEPRRCAG